MTNNFNVPKNLLDFSQMNPDKKAIVYNEQSITYLEFKDMVISLSNELKQLGIGKNDFVDLYMSNSIEMVLSIFSILNCKAIVIPINIDLPLEQLSRILGESNPKMILYNEHAKNAGSLNNYNRITAHCVDYKKIETNHKSENELFSFEPNDLAYCIFTSGSSGLPKGVLLSYEGVLNHFEA